jgi:hypothetical protein
VEGIVLEVPAQVLIIPNTNEHIIGVSILERVITEIDDPSLRDPIKGGALYGMEGSSRLVWKASIVVNDADAFPIGKIRSGQVLQKSTSINSKLLDQQALYTYERSGNFRVKGFEVIYSSRIEDDSLNTKLSNSNTQRDNTLLNIRDIQREISQLETNLINLERDLLESDSYTQLFIENLSSRIELLKAEIINRKASLIVKQTELSSILLTLVNIETTAPKREVLSINPGIAYVEGYRVIKTQPLLIEIPKRLEAKEVKGVKFLYSGTKPNTSRLLIFNTAANFNQVKSSSTVIELVIEGVSYDSISIPIRVFYSISPTSNIQSIDSLLNALVTDLKSNSVIPANLIFSTRSNLDINQYTLRQLLRANVEISKSSTNSLLFSSNNEGVVIKSSVNNRTLRWDLYETGLNTNPSLNSYQLGFKPVKEIKRLTAERIANQVIVNRSPILNGIDTLMEDSIVRVLSIEQGGTSFIEGRDYHLINQHQIDWGINLVNSIEPEIGSSYLITYVYTQELELGTDYIFNPQTDSLTFIGKKPASGYTFSIDYTYYLSQAGILTIDKEGQISYVLSPNSSNPYYPAAPDNLLILSQFILRHNSIDINPSNSKRWTFSDINALSKKIRENAINNEILSSLLRSSIDPLHSPIGLYNDPLINPSSINLTLSTASILPSLLALSLSINSKDIPIKYDGGGTLYNRLDQDSYVSLPSFPLNLYEQDRVTRSRAIPKVNITTQGVMQVYPSTLFTNNNIANKVSPIDPISSFIGSEGRLKSNSIIVNSLRSSVNNLLGASADLIASSIKDGNAVVNSSYIDSNGYIDLMTNNIDLARGELYIKVTNLPARLNGFRLYISGIEVTSYITIKNTSRTTAGIRSDIDGQIELKFPIPNNISAGVHLIEVKSINSLISNSAKGRVSIFNNILNQTSITSSHLWSRDTILTSSNEMLALSYPDIAETGSIPPFEYLMQTFSVDEANYLSSIDIKLKEIALDKDIYLVIRSVDNLPQHYILAYAHNTSLAYSNDASTYTTFFLDNPLLLLPGKEYCIGICAPKGYSIFTSVIGKPDLLNGKTIGLQPLRKGHLWISPNGYDLIPQTNEDLSYRFNSLVFNQEEETILLGEYGINQSFANTTHFCLNTRDISPYNTYVQYQYLVDDIWIDFLPNVCTPLIESTNLIKVRARIGSSNNRISPLLSLEGTSISLYSYSQSGVVISNLKEYSQPYHNVSLSIEVFNPLSFPIRCYTSQDGIIWIALIPRPSMTKVIDPALLLEELTYRVEGLSPSINRRQMFYKIELNSPILGSTRPPVIRNITTYVY